MTTIILCETPGGCTCGAPASTPAGMHHCDCAVHPGWCGQASCLPCERNGKVTTPPTATEASTSVEMGGVSKIDSTGPCDVASHNDTRGDGEVSDG